jgi:Glycosyl transferase family 11
MDLRPDLPLPEPSRKKRRVILVANGGLGNQLFQYAAGFSFAVRHDAELVIDSITGFQADPYERSYALGHFRISAPLLASRDKPSRHPWLEVSKLYWKYREIIRLRYLGRTFDPAAVERPFRKVAILEGYYQSPLYFRDHEDCLRREFTPSVELTSESKIIAQQICAMPSVAVHIRTQRRASATGNIIDSRTWSLDTSSLSGYYRTALELIVSKRGMVHCFIFSDSPEWAQHAIPANLPNTLVSRNGTKRDYEDLYLMTLCRDHVIAQSTFSWWGAWLSSHPSQIAIAPKYFAPGFRELADVYPEQWLVL